MAITTFDPGQHLTKIKGQDYLEVKWRVAWLRSEHPDAILTTELHSHEAGRAVFSAHVQLSTGAAATGWGSETIDTFENYIEKAETKAIGRALAAIGYGTQFCDDFNDAGALADTPVASRQGNQGPGPGPARQQAPARGGSRSQEQLATSAQQSMIQYKARNAQMDDQDLGRFIHEMIGKTFAELTKQEASRVIQALEQRGRGNR